MAITIKTKYDFWKKIKATSPASDGGVEVSEFEVQFSYNPEKSKKMLEDMNNALDHEQETMATGFMCDAVIGWRGVEDANGTAIPFSTDTLKGLMLVPWAGQAILDAYLEAIKGSPSLGN